MSDSIYSTINTTLEEIRDELKIKNDILRDIHAELIDIKGNL